MEQKTHKDLLDLASKGHLIYINGMHISLDTLKSKRFEPYKKDIFLLQGSHELNGLSNKYSFTIKVCQLCLSF